MLLTGVNNIAFFNWTLAVTLDARTDQGDRDILVPHQRSDPSRSTRLLIFGASPWWLYMAAPIFPHAQQPWKFQHGFLTSGVFKSCQPVSAGYYTKQLEFDDTHVNTINIYMDFAGSGNHLQLEGIDCHPFAVHSRYVISQHSIE